MTGLERQYLRECIKGLIRARAALLDLPCERAISKVDYGKSDTLWLDAAPEAALIRSLCEEFDPHLPFVTEETGYDVQLKGSEEEVVCFSDPMDRSKVLADFLASRQEQETVKSLFATEGSQAEWEKKNGGDIELTGPYGSITAIRHHHIIFNAMVNYFSGQLYVASDAGSGSIALADVFDKGECHRLKRTTELISSLKPITFAEFSKTKPGDGFRFVAYCKGKKYEDNLLASEVSRVGTIEEVRKSGLTYDVPGGPARILYLKDGRTGFILSNGEKIGEWIGWLAWVAHARTLKAYEIAFDSSWTRDEVLMAPGQAYSVLGDEIRRDRGRRSKLVRLNLVKLHFFKNPSQYRSTLLICPASNEELRATLFQEKVTELKFDSD